MTIELSALIKSCDLVVARKNSVLFSKICFIFFSILNPLSNIFSVNKGTSFFSKKSPVNLLQQIVPLMDDLK